MLEKTIIGNDIPRQSVAKSVQQDCIYRYIAVKKCLTSQMNGELTCLCLAVFSVLASRLLPFLLRKQNYHWEHDIYK